MEVGGEGHGKFKFCWSVLYIALFSALEQTQWARMWFYMSEYLFIARFWRSTEVVYLQPWHGWCHMKLLPSRRVLCTPYNHAPWHFMQSHIRKVHAYLAVTCHPHFWQNDRDFLRATAVTRGWNGYRESAQKVDPGKENSPVAPAGIRSRDLSVTSPPL